jgi:hypothetical protein
LTVGHEHHDHHEQRELLDLEAPPIEVRGLVSRFGDMVVHD